MVVCRASATPVRSGVRSFHALKNAEWISPSLTWTQSQFAYVPWWFWLFAPNQYPAMLRSLGPAGPLVLVKRETLGDDRVGTRGEGAISHLDANEALAWPV